MFSLLSAAMFFMTVMCQSNTPPETSETSAESQRVSVIKQVSVGELHPSSYSHQPWLPAEPSTAHPGPELVRASTSFVHGPVPRPAVCRFSDSHINISVLKASVALIVATVEP